MDLFASWRGRVVRICIELKGAAVSYRRSASQLEIDERTLRCWRKRVEQKEPLAARRGRPPQSISVSDRAQVDAYLRHLGPHVGLRRVQIAFLHLPWREVEALHGDYREAARRAEPKDCELEWCLPGCVWAADYSEAPGDSAPNVNNIFALRELALGYQILWRAVGPQSAKQTKELLALSFAEHGAPLVLKVDNGSPIIGEDLEGWLLDYGVVLLRSPPRTPEYNGAIEAGIGTHKARTEECARLANRPGVWFPHDLTAAQRESNEIARPWGRRGPSRAARWAGQARMNDDQRIKLAITIAHEREKILAEEPVTDASLPRPQPNETITASRARRAIERALVELGCLNIRRARIPPPVRTRKADAISR